MATKVNANTLGVVEVARRFNAEKLLPIAEVLPKGTWRKINGGVEPEASQTEAVEEGIGFLESYSQVDKALLDISPNPEAVRQSEDEAFLEGLAQTWADTLLAGDAAVDPETFTGLQPRLSTLANPNVIDQGGTADGAMTSLYIVQWGKKRVHMIHPTNSPGAVEMDDLGEQTVTDETGKKKFQAMVSHFKFYGGLFVHDTRCIKRICNIDLSDITGLDNKIIEALNALPYGGRGAILYCNVGLKTALEVHAKDKSNVHYGVRNLWGEPVTDFRGVPVRQWDSITTTEAQVA